MAGFYLCLSGTKGHTENGVSYSKDDVVNSEHKLDILFPNKFKKISKKHAAKLEEVEEEEEQEEEENEEDSKGLGKEVTSLFASAAKAVDVKVFVNGKDYWVTDVDDEQTALNPKPLKRNQVKKYLESMKDKQEDE